MATQQEICQCVTVEVLEKVYDRRSIHLELIKFVKPELSWWQQLEIVSVSSPFSPGTPASPGVPAQTTHMNLWHDQDKLGVINIDAKVLSLWDIKALPLSPFCPKPVDPDSPLGPASPSRPLTPGRPSAPCSPDQTYKVQMKCIMLHYPSSAFVSFSLICHLLRTLISFLSFRTLRPSMSHCTYDQKTKSVK